MEIQTLHLFTVKQTTEVDKTSGLVGAQRIGQLESLLTRN